MTLFRGSRYRFGEVIQVQDSEGEVNRVHVRRNTTNIPTKGTRSYVALAGDTFEKIAEREYGDANKWYVLADANPEVFWPLDLQAGIQIRIPPRSFAAIQ